MQITDKPVRHTGDYVQSGGEPHRPINVVRQLLQSATPPH
jgi:hypothetical protein